MEWFVLGKIVWGSDGNHKKSTHLSAGESEAENDIHNRTRKISWCQEVWRKHGKEMWVEEEACERHKDGTIWWLRGRGLSFTCIERDIPGEDEVGERIITADMYVLLCARWYSKNIGEFTSFCLYRNPMKRFPVLKMRTLWLREIPCLTPPAMRWQNSNLGLRIHFLKDCVASKAQVETCWRVCVWPTEQMATIEEFWVSLEF